MLLKINGIINIIVHQLCLINYKTYIPHTYVYCSVIGKKRHGKKRQVKNVMVKIHSGKKRHRKKRQK